MEQQKEQLAFIELANELNQEMYEKHGDIVDRFYFMTDGYCDVFGFGDKILWHSEDDDRKFIEELDDYEPFKPFILKKFNSWINELSKYVFVE
jgi:hypothetical protein